MRELVHMHEPEATQGSGCTHSYTYIGSPACTDMPHAHTQSNTHIHNCTCPQVLSFSGGAEALHHLATCMVLPDLVWTLLVLVLLWY